MKKAIREIKQTVTSAIKTGKHQYIYVDRANQVIAISPEPVIHLERRELFTRYEVNYGTQR